ALLAADRAAHLDALLPVLGTAPGPVFLAGEAAWEPPEALRGVRFVRLEFPPPTAAERLGLWRAALARHSATADPPPNPTVVAGAFRLTGGQIEAATATAGNLAAARDPDAPRVTEADLHAACRLQSTSTLATLAV